MHYKSKPILVEAWVISEVERYSHANIVAVHLLTDEVDLNGNPLTIRRKVLAPMLARITPREGDYWVEAPNPDGSTYAYLNPKDVFESKYKPISKEPGAPVPGDLAAGSGAVESPGSIENLPPADTEEDEDVEPAPKPSKVAAKKGRKRKDA